MARISFGVSVILSVKVIPNSKKAEIKKVDEAGYIARLDMPAEKGKARDIKPGISLLKSLFLSHFFV